MAAWRQFLSVLAVALAVCGALLPEGTAAGEVIEMNGSGTTNVQTWMRSTLSALADSAGSPVRLSYRAVGSSNGQKDFVAATNHIACADYPLTTERYNAVTATSGTILTLPLAIGAVGIFAHIPGASSQLKLTPCVAAKIFDSTITRWDHPELLADNPWLASTAPANQAIQVIRRSDGSSTTTNTSGFFQKACPASWSRGSSSRLDWSKNGVDNTVSAEGTHGVVEAALSRAWSIAYVDAGQGHDAGLAEAQLKNAAGQWVTTQMGQANSADIGRAVRDVVLPTNTQSYASVNFLNSAAPNAWPITAVSYGFVRADQTGAGASGPLIKAVAKWLLSSTGAQASLGNHHFVPLPPSVADAAIASLDNMNLDPAHAEWVFEDASVSVLPNGNAPNVFSTRRTSFASDVVGDVAALQASLASTTARMDQLVKLNAALALELQYRVASLEAAAADSDGLLGEAEGDSDGKLGEAEGDSDGKLGEAEGSVLIGPFGQIDSDGKLGEAEGDSDGKLGEAEGDSDGLLDENEGDSDGKLDENEGDSDGLLDENEGEGSVGDTYHHKKATTLHVLSLTIASVGLCLGLVALVLAVRKARAPFAYLHHEGHSANQYVVRKQTGCLGVKSKMPCTKAGDDDSIGETIHVNNNLAAQFDTAPGVPIAKSAAM